MYKKLLQTSKLLGFKFKVKPDSRIYGMPLAKDHATRLTQGRTGTIFEAWGSHSAKD